MADLAALTKQRQALVSKLQAAGGKAKNPAMAKELASLDTQIKGLRAAAPSDAQPTTGQEAGPTTPPPGGDTSGSSTGTPTAPAQDDPFGNTPGKTKTAFEAGLDSGKVNQQGSILGENANISGPFGSQTTTVDPVTGQATVTQKLSDDQQAILDKGSALTKMGQDLANQNLQGYQKYQVDNSKMPGTYTADTSGMGGYQADLSGMPEQYKADTSGMGAYNTGAGAGNVVDKKIGNYQDFSFDSSDAGRQRIEDQAFARLSRGMDTRHKQQSADLEQSLYNRGIQFSSDPNSRYQQELKSMQQSQQEEEQSYRQQATQLGGEEMARSYSMAQGTHSQNMSDLNQMSGLSQSQYSTNLSGNEARNSAGLSEYRAGLQGVQTKNDIALQAAAQDLAANQARNDANLQQHNAGLQDFNATNAANLTAHQQEMSDTAALQGMGTGLQVPNFQEFKGAEMDVNSGAAIQQGFEQLAANKGLTSAQANYYNARAKDKVGGSSSSSSSSGTSPFQTQ